jgi:hypothetical protein
MEEPKIKKKRLKSVEATEEPKIKKRKTGVSVWWWWWCGVCTSRGRRGGGGGGSQMWSHPRSTASDDLPLRLNRHIQEEDDKKKKKKAKKRLLGSASSSASSASSKAAAKEEGKKKREKPSSSLLPSGKAASASSSSASTQQLKATKKRSAGAAGHEDDEDTWEGCWSGDRRLAAVSHGAWMSGWVAGFVLCMAVNSDSPPSVPLSSRLLQHINSITRAHTHTLTRSTGVAWVLKQLPASSPAAEAASEAVPALYALVRLTLDPVRQDVLEALAPHLEAWKHRCLAAAAAAAAAAAGAAAEEEEEVGVGKKGKGKGKGQGRWSQAALIGALRRIVQLERLGVYAQEEAKRALADAYVSGACVGVGETGPGTSTPITSLGLNEAFQPSPPPC